MPGPASIAGKYPQFSGSFGNPQWGGLDAAPSANYLNNIGMQGGGQPTNLAGLLASQAPPAMVGTNGLQVGGGPMTGNVQYGAPGASKPLSPVDPGFGAWDWNYRSPRAAGRKPSIGTAGGGKPRIGYGRGFSPNTRAQMW